jgi:hypothetical protein
LLSILVVISGDLQDLKPPVGLLLAGAFREGFTWGRSAGPPATSWTPPLQVPFTKCLPGEDLQNLLPPYGLLLCRCPSQSVYLGKICRTSCHQLDSSFAGALHEGFTWGRPAEPPAASWSPLCRCPSLGVYLGKICRTSCHQLDSSLQVPFTKGLPGEDLQDLQPLVELLLAGALHKVFTWERSAGPLATS